MWFQRVWWISLRVRLRARHDGLHEHLGSADRNDALAGSDPQGNPDAEASADVTAHELVEAVTDPTGDGWMDPNGNEVADKCENGPNRGAPLGFAPDGSPYNQLINGDRYLVQTMWSNAQAGCVTHSSATTSALPLAQVHLTQFSSSVSGRLPTARGGVSVLVSLVRAGTEVAHVRTRSRADGSWGPVGLTSLSRRSRHAVGDDRDELDVICGLGGPRDDVVLTGDGGNPFIEAGWTGWYALDNGYAIASNRTGGAIALEPCSQTGVLGLLVNRTSIGAPVDTCETEADASIVQTPTLSAGSTIRMSSSDNRAVTPINPDGALVSLTVPLGEPNSRSALGNPLVPIGPSGFPACSTDLQSGLVRCTGLVPTARYILERTRGDSRLASRASSDGSIRAAGFRSPRRLTGGDVIRLRNAAGAGARARRSPQGQPVRQPNRDHLRHLRARRLLRVTAVIAAGRVTDRRGASRDRNDLPAQWARGRPVGGGDRAVR